MSILIDNLIINFKNCNQQFNNEWYIAKPFGLQSFRHRLKDAYRVLIGKSYAYHFKEDELESR